MENKTRNVFNLWGKPYVIYSSNNFTKLSDSFELGSGPKSSTIVWMIRPGSEIAEMLDSGIEKMLGVINTECLVYASQATSKMECHNSYQYESIAAKKVEAVLEFIRSDSYLFTLGT